MALTLAPSPYYTGLDDSGVTLVGALLYTYSSGTTTKQPTYTDAAGSSANTNPIVLDAAGRAVIYLSPTAYKFVLAPSNDTDPPTSPIKTVDPVNGVPPTAVSLDITGLAGEDLLFGQVVYLSDGVGGAGTAGLWWLADSDFAYSSIGAATIGIMPANLATGAVGAFGGSVRIMGRITGLSGLTAGTNYYVSATAGALTATPPANARLVGFADSTTSLVLALKREDNVRRVAAFTAAVATIGAGEDILATYSDGVSGLYLDGMGWEGRFWGDSVNNANAKQLRFRLIEGANNNLVANFPLTAGATGFWDLSFSIVRIGATTFSSVATVINGVDTGPISRGGNNVLVGATGTMANVIELRLTGEATTTGDVRMVGGFIKRIGLGL